MSAPTFEVRPEGDAAYSTAADAIELARIAGIELLDWQADQVHRILAQRSNGQWHAARHGLCVPRQNGKGVVLEVVVLAATVILGERVLWTAHEVRTMQDSFARFRAIFDSTPSLAQRVDRVRVANGQESMTFTNGARVKFSARSKSATRGLGFRRIIADEAQELDYTAMGALLPTLSGQGTAATQLILTGTPPYSKSGEVFTDTRAAAHEGGDPRLSWSEWSCEASDRTDDRAIWERTNPSIGRIVMEQKIEDEHAALASRPEVFRRERLGEWGRSGDVQLALDPEAWAAGSTPRETWPARDNQYRRGPKPVRILAIDATFDRDQAYVAEAIPLDDGSTATRILAAAPGLDWITPAFQELTEHAWPVVVYDPARVGDLAPDLEAAGLRNTGARRQIIAATSRDLMTACDGLVRLTDERRLHHQDPRLDAAAACAIRSTYQDGRGWKLVATDSGNVAPLIAAALALGALRAYPSRKRGSGRMVGA